MVAKKQKVVKPTSKGCHVCFGYDVKEIRLTAKSGAIDSFGDGILIVACKRCGSVLKETKIERS